MRIGSPIGAVPAISPPRGDPETAGAPVGVKIIGGCGEVFAGTDTSRQPQTNRNNTATKAHPYPRHHFLLQSYLVRVRRVANRTALQARRAVQGSGTGKVEKDVVGE